MADIFNFGPDTHMQILLSDVNSRFYNPNNFVTPLSIWLYMGEDAHYVYQHEIDDMIWSGMTGGESL